MSEKWYEYNLSKIANDVTYYTQRRSILNLSIQGKIKPVALLVFLEPSLNEQSYESKYVPLIEKHLDSNLFAFHLVGSSKGSRVLKRKFSDVHLISLGPAKSSGISFYIGYILYLIFGFFKIIRLACKINVDVFVSLGGHAYSGFVTALTARVLRKKSVIRISEPTRYVVRLRYKFGSLISCLVGIIERASFSLCDVVISNRNMTWYSSKIKSKQILLSQGVDLSLFNPRVAPAFCSKAFPKLITVARLDKPKNIESTIRAVGLLREKYPEISYHIVGSGPAEVDLRSRVTKFGLNSHIYFHGYISPEMIPRLLRSCDIFILPSFVEGLPSAVLEAMACGIPVIVGSTRYGQSKWFIDGKNTLLVRTDPLRIAKAIDKLVSDKDLTKRLKANGLAFIKEYHDSSKTKVGFTKIIKELLKTKGYLCFQ